MSKQLKIDDEVYHELDTLRGRGDTFSSVIWDLLKARIKVLELINILEGDLRFREWQREQLEKLQATH